MDVFGESNPQLSHVNSDIVLLIDSQSQATNCNTYQTVGHLIELLVRLSVISL